jgi:glutamine cyclotransferase
MKLCILLGLTVALSSCTLLRELDDTVNGRSGLLRVVITAPVGQVAKVTLKGPSIEESFTDDARGFTRDLEARPGLYEVSTSKLEGFNAWVELSDLKGNARYADRATAQVFSEEVTTVNIKYQSLTTPPGEP